MPGMLTRRLWHMSWTSPQTLLLAATLTACTASPPQSATPVPQLPPTAVHWTRTAAEHRALFLQTYRHAGEQLRELVRGRTSGTWGVIMDADETVLDNSEYQRRITLRGERYDTATWHAWIREIAADTLPGASGFIRLVRELGGRVVVVTGREDAVCAETRDNLQRLSVPVDVVLCQRPNERGKAARFDAVARGTTGSGLPALEVVMFVGDNIQDFPGMAQDARSAAPHVLDRFGRTWFILPNPMYGSWERNPAR